MYHELHAEIENNFLPLVRKPNRYAGLELNRIVKQNPEVRWALCFPDLYEIAMSHQGLAILYHCLNTTFVEVAAERAYLPDEEAAAILRRNKIPLYTLETHTPLCEVDVVGISLAYEMAIPGMLELLDLGGLPIHASDRKEGDPIVIVGGPVVFNPEPFADFVDIVALGDGEEISVEISNILLESKRCNLSRNQKLDRLATLPGIYFPAQYPMEVSLDGFMIAKKPVSGEPSDIIISRTVRELKSCYYTHRPLVPLLEITHDRLVIELARGCTRGCRFCHAGMIYRPVRERIVPDIVEQAVDSIAATGFEEISLSSLSTSDYNNFPLLIGELHQALRGKGVSLSYHSLRPDSFTEEMARAFPEGRKGGMTFAPEAGTPRLRSIINKNTSDADLARAAELAYSAGYNGVKLYFMIGLPTETREDLDGIVKMSLMVARLRKSRHQKTTVSISPFVPKSHTPFQWVGQDTPEVLAEKLKYLQEKFQSTPIRFISHSPRNALFEGALSRGDRRLCRVIENVWRSGGTLESWGDRFNPERWTQAFHDAGLQPEKYVGKRDPETILPWSHLSKGITVKFFRKEWERAQRGEEVDDCRQGTCDACGLTTFIPKGEKVCQQAIKPPELHLNQAMESNLQVEVVSRARICYQRNERFRWTGHRDMVRLWERLLRQTQLPLAFSKGYHPHPRLSFGMPLPLGCISEAEFLDLDLAESLPAGKLKEQLENVIPEALTLRRIATFQGKAPKLTAKIDKISYTLPSLGDQHFQEYVKSWMEKQTYVIMRNIGGKSRPLDLRQFVESVTSDSAGKRWEVILKVCDGSTARLDELFKAWNFPTFNRLLTCRSGVFAQLGQEWLDPIQILNQSAHLLSIWE